jgi:hypothetical protein
MPMASVGATSPLVLVTHTAAAIPIAMKTFENSGLKIIMNIAERISL